MNLNQIEIIKRWFQPTSKIHQSQDGTYFTNFDSLSQQRIYIYVDSIFFDFELQGVRHRSDGPAQIYQTQTNHIRLNWFQYGLAYKSITIPQQPIPLDLFKDFTGVSR